MYDEQRAVLRIALQRLHRDLSELSSFFQVDVDVLDLGYLGVLDLLLRKRELLEAAAHQSCGDCCLLLFEPSRECWSQISPTMALSTLAWGVARCSHGMPWRCSSLHLFDVSSSRRRARNTANERSPSSPRQTGL